MTNQSINISEVIEWDVANWSQALIFWKINSNLNLEETLALELGARNGGLSFWLAQHGAKVVCSDIDGPTDQAYILHKKYNLTHLIEYKAVDALSIPYNNHFDLVIFKSILGGIGRDSKIHLQRKTFNEIYKCLKPGGEIWFAENLKASFFHQFFRENFVTWGKSWRYVTPKEIDFFLSSFHKKNYLFTGFLGAFGRNESQKKILGTIDHYFLNKIIPKNWKYIIIGVAQKY